MPGIGTACLRPDGLWALLDPDGQVIGLTHGPDTALSSHRVMDGYRFGEEVRDWPYDYGTTPKPPICVTAGAGSHFGQLVYVRPIDAEDRYSIVAATMRANMGIINNRLYTESEWVGTGVLTQFRMACEPSLTSPGAQQLSVRNQVLPYNLTQAKDEDLITWLQALGYDQPFVQYWVVFDIHSYSYDTAGNQKPPQFYFDYSPSAKCGCAGYGTMPGDDTPGYSNLVNVVNGYGISYGPSMRTMFHENGHNMGAVLSTAPGADGKGHCVDGVDIMCYAPPSPYDDDQCTDADHYDCGHDTYFHPGPPLASTWLGSHWNVGHENMYLHYTQGTVQPLRAVDDYYVATVELGVAKLHVAKNDNSPFLRPFWITGILSPPSKGTATVDADLKHIHYDPVDLEVGTDAFTYGIVDDIGQTSVGTVHVDIDHYPEPIDHHFNITPGDSVTYYPTYKCDSSPMATDVDPRGDLDVRYVNMTTWPDPGSPPAVVTMTSFLTPCVSSGYWIGGPWTPVQWRPHMEISTISLGQDFRGTATLRFQIYDHHTRRDGHEMGGCCKSYTWWGYVNITQRDRVYPTYVPDVGPLEYIKHNLSAGPPPDPVPDTDQDGVADSADNCPGLPNRDQRDLDFDGVGDLCGPETCVDLGHWDDGLPCTKEGIALSRLRAGEVPDADSDGITDVADSCPQVPNTDQADLDRDGFGDACDLDADNDGAADATDTCPRLPDPRQADRDGDGQGDLCEPANRASGPRARPEAPATAGQAPSLLTPGMPVYLGLGFLAAVALAILPFARRRK